MGIFAILIILVNHWLADFVFQSDEIAKGKSTSINTLFEHAFYYTVAWLPLILFLITFYKFSFIFFLPITFLSHALIDYYTSKANKQLWESKNSHEFFASIGLDQMLHYIQLFITFKVFLNV